MDERTLSNKILEYYYDKYSEQKIIAGFKCAEGLQGYVLHRMWKYYRMTSEKCLELYPMKKEYTDQDKADIQRFMSDERNSHVIEMYPKIEHVFDQYVSQCKEMNITLSLRVYFTDESDGLYILCGKDNNDFISTCIQSQEKEFYVMLRKMAVEFNLFGKGCFFVLYW